MLTMVEILPLAVLNELYSGFLADFRLGEGEEKCASFAGVGFYPDYAGIQFYNLFDNRQADAGAVGPIFCR